MIEVTAGILTDGERILICQRRAGESFGLKWEFPGGKVEPGETAEDCLARELREELCLDVDVGPEVHRTEHAYPNGLSVRLLFYRILRYRGTLQNFAFERMAWVLPGDLRTYDFLDADRDVVERVVHGEISLR